MNTEHPQPDNTGTEASQQGNGPTINDDSNFQQQVNEGSEDSSASTPITHDSYSEKLFGTVLRVLFWGALIAVVAWFIYVLNDGTYKAHPGEDEIMLNDSLSISPAAHWPYKGYRLYKTDNHEILFNDIDDYCLTSGDMFLCLYFDDEIQLINCETNKVMPGRFKYVGVLKDSLIAVCTLDNMLSFIDEKGKVIIKDVCQWPTDLEDCEYSDIPCFDNGYCLINTPKGTGLLDKKGRWRLQPGDYVISNRINQNSWIVYDKSGKGVYNVDSTSLTVPCAYIDVMTDEKTGLVVADTHADRTFLDEGHYYGDIVIENMSSLGNGIYMYESSGVYGLFSERVGIITPPVYRSISQIGRNIACFVHDRDAIQWYNHEGKLLNM